MDPACISAFSTTLDASPPVAAKEAVLYKILAKTACVAGVYLDTPVGLPSASIESLIPKSLNALVTYSLLRNKPFITVAVISPPDNCASTALAIMVLAVLGSLLKDPAVDLSISPNIAGTAD